MVAMKTRVGFVAALLTFAAAFTPLAAISQTQTDALLLQIPSSGIRISRVDFYKGGRAQPWWGSACVAVTNEGALAVSRITLDVAWTQANGLNEFDEFLVLNGPLAPGATLGAVNGRAANSPVTCRPTSHGSETGSANGRAHAFVTAVTYQNGTTWRLVPPVAGSVVNGRGSPATLSDINTYDYAPPTALAAWRAPAGFLPQACSTIANQSAKAISGVRIAYQHLTTSGADLGDDELDVRVTIPAHGTNINNCRSFVAAMQPALLAYAERAAATGNSQPPVYVYNGVPSVLSARITGVTFADGTSWQSAVPISWKSQSDDATILQQPSSGVRIDQVDLQKGNYSGLASRVGVWGSECAAATNVGDTATTFILYDFAWVRPYGAAVIDEIEPLIGALAPGAKSGLGCWPTFHGAENYASDAQPQVFVLDVYRKGAPSWSLIPPVAGSAINTAGSPVSLSDVTVLGFSAMAWKPNLLTENGIPSIPSGPPESECSTIRNETAKAISDVRITYRHLTSDGMDIGDDRLDVHATIAPQTTRTSNCLGFYATMQPSVLAYAQMSQEGPGLEPPVYLYKGMPSVISAQVTSVAFSDNTSWTLP